jgi:hypothetical protein
MANAANNSSGQFLWNGPSLLVPVDVEALVVSKLSQNLPWSYNRMKYNNAGKYLDVQPSLLVDAEKPSVGITLHWAMPDGITHGQQQTDGTDIIYPFLPNRWLVIRYYDGKSKSWILQSDYIDPTNGLSFFLNPNTAAPSFTRIGKVWPADQWPGEDAVTQQHFLKAIGPGNPAFTAYTANINGVFSFYDNMDDIIDRATPVTYTVLGWYGNAADDPLHTFATLDEWLALMNNLQWTVGDTNDIQRAVNDWVTWANANGIAIDQRNPRDIYPSHTICQGMVYNVNWLGQNGALQSGVPQYNPSMPAEKQPRIAIANTAVDALAALVEYELTLTGHDGSAAAELLEAFNNNLLDKYETQGGEFELYREIFKSWFGNIDSEDFYYIEDTEKPTAPFIAPERLEKLVLLNQRSQQLNINQHLLRSAQAGLYGDWWKSAKAKEYLSKPPQGVTKEQWAAIQANLKSAIPQDKDAVTSLQRTIEGLAAEMAQLVIAVEDGLPTTQELKKNIGPRYHQANDPVVLVYGANRAYRHGEDGRFDDNDLLFTRFTGQTITCLNVMLPGQPAQPVTSNDVTVPPVNLPVGKVPKETGSLCVETYFFDTRNAEAIARAACKLLGIPFEAHYTAVVAAQQTAAWNADVHDIDRQLVTDAAGFIGVIPSKIAVNPWAAPWAPLFMAWEVKWFPSYNQPSEALAKWKFDPATLEYGWDTAFNIGSTSYTLSGSALITPKSAFVMQAQLEKYFEDTGQFPDLKNFLNTVSNWDFLTQNMGGFNDQLITLTTAQLNQAPADINPLVGTMSQFTPVPDQSAGYFPIRAGHFQLSKLWIVDDFGQVFDPISAVGQLPASYQPVIGTGMVTPNDAKLVQLPPRLTQATRFNFNFVPGDGKGTDTLQQNQTANPICGWMLPNHLDKGLSIYTPDGLLLGELLLTGSFTNMKLRWDNAPGKNIPVGAPLADVIDNQYMRSFVERLLQREDSAAAFIEFMSVIDETLWTVEPLGGRNNELIAVFIGRPLALVKTTMQYSLMGNPVYSQSWLNSTLGVTGGYEGVRFPVQVGSLQNPQDGTIGYYLDDFYTFNTILSAQIATSSGYITHQPVSLAFNDPAKNVFILADPRGDINAITGILPVQVNAVSGTRTEEAMANMNVTFRTGPLITNPDQLSMPLPSQMSGQWSWIQHTGVTTWEEIKQIAQANAQARLGTDYELKEGWLQLSNALLEHK